MLKEKIVRTSKGYPAIWEQGGGMTRTGFSYIVAGIDGEKLVPVYIRKRGQLSCGEHALFVLREGMHIVVCNRTNDEYQVKALKFTKGDFLEVEQTAKLQPAIEAAREKTRFYHCRQPVFFLHKEDTCDNNDVAISVEA